jgi:hypothetical protein
MSTIENTSAPANLHAVVRPFYQDEYATIALDNAIPCIRLTLTGVPRYSEHYQYVQTKRLELMNREIGNYPKLNMLTDSRTAGPVLDEDVAYFKSLVLPTMEKAGIRNLAIVMPTSKFTQLTIQEMTQRTRTMEVRYFELLEEAKNWLRKMNRR